MSDPGRIVRAESTAGSRAISALCFASGAAALIYEVSWSRQIGLVLGQTAQSGGVVLAGYFAGMAFGYALAGRMSRRIRPLLGYGIAELVAAVWAVLLPSTLDALRGPMAGGWLDPEAAGLRVAVRASACFLLLLPATAALGASLPFIAEALSPARRVAAGRVARAYAWNTAGALLGVLAATAVLLVAVGVRGSSYLAAAISAACGMAAIGLSAVGGPGPGREESGAGHVARGRWPWYVLAAGSGFATLGVQVLHTRMFALTFNNSTHTFGLVVAAWLGGLSIGSALYARARRRWEPATIAPLAGLAGASGVAGSVLVFAGVTGLGYFESGPGWWAYLLGASGLVALIVLPPASILGMLLPCCWDAVGSGPSGGGGGSVVGRLTAANAMAAAAGALAAGFVLLPGVGLWASIGVMAGSVCLASMPVLVRSGRRGSAIGLGVLVAGLIAAAVRIPGEIRTLPPGRDLSIAASWEGPYGRIEVVDVGSGVRVLRQDLHYGLGSSGPARLREYRQGLLPLLLHPRPESVLFLGLGTGLTAAPATLHPRVRRVDVVELIPEVVEAARRFADENFGVVDHPSVDIRVDDARHDLLAGAHAYDVIVSDLFIPWESKSGYLYSVDFYELARGRLAEGGLFCQWLPLYQLGRPEFGMIADGFARVFPHSTLWWGGLSAEKGIVALVGSDRPPTIDDARIEAVLPRVRGTLDDPDPFLGSPGALRRLRIGDWPAPPPGAVLNTDEHPRVEFRAPARQQSDRLLTGDRLLSLFDEVFRRLPDASTRSVPPDRDPSRSAYRRRVWQRGRLIGPGRE
ncbi:spermine/spermidine synthase domain-containing protein [Tautonia plasticadhaerens]|uniref:Spermidine synthase n=1 Tax=Tautonia plasticadhaerens TaxID=2527974 RepID=A0A518GVB0_9BACT|nr:spermidine synthase [Tautonia plasticadhaerens]QDV32527.1 Spermidine synthase [Tautonia plasticadhaerens]